MFAVLNTGGKQYKVSQGDLIEVEKLESDVGDKVTLSQVLKMVIKLWLSIYQPPDLKKLMH